VPAPPQGPTTVVARLKPAEPALQRGAPDGQLASIDLSAYASQLGYPLLTGAYGQLASESPSVPNMPFPFPKPSTDEGTHLSYSLQWFAFGVLMFVGFGYAARQQARNAAIDAEDAEAEAADGVFLHSSGPAVRRRPAPRKRKNATAEEEEDAILDAQGF
jgi:cytochrome oxidase assembly protein ShyY1